MAGTADAPRDSRINRPYILYLTSSASAEETAAALGNLSRRSADVGDQAPGDHYEIALDDGSTMSVHMTASVDQMIDWARSQPVDAIVVDNRAPECPTAFSASVAGRALPELLSRLNQGRRLKKSAVIVVIPQNESTAQHAFAVGALQLGGVLVAPGSMKALLSSVCRSVRRPEKGAVALCLAGGGIEGLFYELGVLRALDDCLGGSVLDFDIFSGISAGAVLAACLANGISPADLGDALKGLPSRIDPITRGMLFDPNVGEIAHRLTVAVKDLIRGEWLKKPLDAAMRVTPNALFSGDRLRWYLETQFGKPGMTNDFHRLEKSLFIGATDQDTATHVTFGEPDMRDVPISHAVRASTAMTPYYPPEKIKGRFYIDGIFTRTVNLDVAISHGARLIVCIDPLTPVAVNQPGYVSGRGGFFNTVQSIKSMIRTRFSEVIGRAEEAYPNVQVVVFSPTPRDLEKMSGTMMRFFYRTETEEMAYASASERIKEDYPWLAMDFERHGLRLRRPS